MSNLFQIDVSSPNKEDDLIEIKIGNDDSIEVNFSKLVSQSKYVRDKYNYSEALNFLQPEIEEIENEYHINEESIKYFIQLIQEGKANIPIEHYKDIYTLSEYFHIPKFASVLDKISQKSLFNDLNFTIQTLLDSEKVNNQIDSKLTNQIENFLRERIDECIENEKFKELPVSTIYRIFDRNKFDHNLLVDFILKSSKSHFILFKFVEHDKLKSDKIDEMIEFIDSQEEATKQMCLEYMPFNFQFVKNMKIRYDQLLKEMNEMKQELEQMKTNYEQTKRKLNQTKIKNDQIIEEHNQIIAKFEYQEKELNQTKQELDQTKQELDQTKQELNQIKQELNQTKQELDQTKQELNQTKQELDQTKQELNQIKQELNQTKQELDQTKQELNQSKQELNQTKQELNQAKQEKEIYKRELKQFKDASNHTKDENKQYTQFIIVGGICQHNGLGEKPNNKKNNFDIISPPVKLPFDPSSLLSYSVYSAHSVLVMSDGSLKGVGLNKSGQICGTLQKRIINHFTDFSIKDGSGRQLAAISAVCCFNGTLYMFSKSSGNERQLVLCDYQINRGDPVFLDIGNHHPVSLFGGDSHSAAIGSEGEVIFINRDSVKNSPKSPIAAVSLPDGEKASSVACCDDSVVVLSSNGRVFTSPIKSNSALNFSIVSELSGQEIVCVSGTYKHCLAVSKEGRVFGRGYNRIGQLGLGKGTKPVSSFTEISSLAGYEIRAAYAGYSHSLFEATDGKILSCGNNKCDQLFLSNNPGENVYSPTETTITSGATFLIAGNGLTVVFTGHSAPPNEPNMRIQQS